MCVDPATMFMVLTMASGAVNAYASIQQGNAEYVAGMMNAQVAERNAQAAENEKKNVADAAAIERRRIGERVRAERGEARAKFVGMGLDPEFGTPFDIDQDYTRAGRIDTAIVGRNELTEIGRLDKEQADYLDSAAQSRASAKSARKAGFISAAGAFLGAGATVASRWIAPGATTIPRARSVSSGAPGSILRVGG